ncbi:DUF1428 family protein [Limibaculum sp. M0105]|uniref:DUF1428 family protein n=1 Tax=Thermohalobaculum xanthum TaxID=2753746 RepID=A0A8J7M7C6_9RHOB|nr:DUF1428 domain-containing protein [Thermohalobaculum xanthum]MBK0398889.1 DUF1428 family protein [Thermohalobaculum xanthum]
MAYVDGFLLAVPLENLAAYRRIARKAGKIWIEHGALSYVESKAEDTPRGKLTSFPRAVKLKGDETVVLAWITYRNRRHRDAVVKKVMQDPRMKKIMENEAMPFDGRRMIFGGFTTMLELSASQDSDPRDDG